MIPIFYSPQPDRCQTILIDILRSESSCDYWQILYLVRSSRSIQNNSRMFGNRTVLHIFILLFLTLTISSFLFYKAERTDVNSQITSMGDALWWTLQTATTSTFGPNVENTEGRILGSIIMLVGIGITGAFVSTLASGLIRSRTTLTSEQNPKTILKLRLAKGEITKDEYLELLRLLSEQYQPAHRVIVLCLEED